MINLQLDTILEQVGLSIRERVDNKGLWEEIFCKFLYKPVAYSNASIDYQLAYQYGHGGNWRDISLIICWDSKPVALWPLSLSMKDGRFTLTSQGLPVLPPVFVSDCPDISRKRIIKLCLDYANAIAVVLEIKSWDSGESFTDSVGMSAWHTSSMARDAICALRHELYQDLRPDIAEIKRTFRKSYKSLVVSGLRAWTVGLLDSDGSESVWQEFRNLHLSVAGRVTRSDETWALQFQDIQCDRAFVVWLRNANNEMVGGGLFSFTCDEGLYAVGAYDRTLFDKPLGHLVQYRAIEELKKRGVRWYKIGARPYPSDTPKPTDKEISIAEFKQGFSSHFFPRYHLVHQVVDGKKAGNQQLARV